MKLVANRWRKPISLMRLTVEQVRCTSCVDRVFLRGGTQYPHVRMRCLSAVRRRSDAHGHAHGPEEPVSIHPDNYADRAVHRGGGACAGAIRAPSRRTAPGFPTAMAKPSLSLSLSLSGRERRVSGGKGAGAVRDRPSVTPRPRHETPPPVPQDGVGKGRSSGWCTHQRYSWSAETHYRGGRMT